MESVSIAKDPESAAPADPVETEELKLELVDCGPAYQVNEAGALCYSCFDCRNPTP